MWGIQCNILKFQNVENMFPWQIFHLQCLKASEMQPKFHERTHESIFPLCVTGIGRGNHLYSYAKIRVSKTIAERTLWSSLRSKRHRFLRRRNKGICTMTSGINFAILSPSPAPENPARNDRDLCERWPKKPAENDRLILTALAAFFHDGSDDHVIVMW